MMTRTRKDNTFAEFFSKHRFYRTAEGDIGREHYRVESRISLEMSDGEIEIFPIVEVTQVRLNSRQKQKWIEDYTITSLTKGNW